MIILDVSPDSGARSASQVLGNQSFVLLCRYPKMFLLLVFRCSVLLQSQPLLQLFLCLACVWLRAHGFARRKLVQPLLHSCGACVEVLNNLRTSTAASASSRPWGRTCNSSCSLHHPRKSIPMSTRTLSAESNPSPPQKARLSHSRRSLSRLVPRRLSSRSSRVRMRSGLYLKHMSHR